MRIAFTGPHRTGKTTLALYAKEVVEELTGVDHAHLSGVAKTAGTKLGADMHELEELFRVLEVWLEAYNRSSCYVADRAMLDRAAYWITNCRLCGIVPPTHANFLERMARLHADSLDVLYYVPTGIAFVEEEGKPNEQFQQEVGMTFDWLWYRLLGPGPNRIIRAKTFVFSATDLEDRKARVRERIQLAWNSMPGGRGTL